MKRKEFTLSVLALFLGGTAYAGDAVGGGDGGGPSKPSTGGGGGGRNRGRRGSRGGGRGGSRRIRKKITNIPIKYTGVLESKDGKLSISGSEMPIEVDRGMTRLATKHVGKEVQITGTKITVDGKSKVKVKFIKPVKK